MSIPARQRLARTLALAAALLPVPSAAVSQTPTEAVDVSRDVANVQPAIDAIFGAFETRPLVGIGEAHLLAQLLDFYQALVRDPRFARDIGHVVFESGSASNQGTLDRYLNGEPVPYAELRTVWTDTVGWVPTVTSEGYARFFAEVRQVNLTLPADKRIKVWLGDPPIDWAKITTSEEFRPILDARDSHAAEIIVRNILAKNRKALVIYGGSHFELEAVWDREWRSLVAAADPGGPMSRHIPTLRDIVEKEYPGSFFVAQTYHGFRDDECTRQFEERMASWPMPAIAVSLRGTPMEQEMRRCMTPIAQRLRFPPSVPPEVQERARAIILANAENSRPLFADSILFVGRASELTVAPPFLDFALDEELRTELSRRNAIMTGSPLPAEWGRSFPSAPVPFTARS